MLNTEPRTTRATTIPETHRNEPSSSSRRSTECDSVIEINQSKYPRFTPRREMYVLHREFGRIIDISMGGVRFTYFTTDSVSADLPVDGMLFTNNDDFLDEIPFLVLTDRVISHLFASKYFMKERKIHFGELTESQTRRLERFILKNAHIPQLSYDSRYRSYKSVYTPMP